MYSVHVHVSASSFVCGKNSRLGNKFKQPGPSPTGTAKYNVDVLVIDNVVK